MDVLLGSRDRLRPLTNVWFGLTSLGLLVAMWFCWAERSTAAPLVLPTVTGLLLGYGRHRRRTPRRFVSAVVIYGIPAGLALLFLVMPHPQWQHRLIGLAAIPAAAVGVCISTIVERWIGPHRHTLRAQWRDVPEVGTDDPAGIRLRVGALWRELPPAAVSDFAQRHRSIPRGGAARLGNVASGFALVAIALLIFGMAQELAGGEADRWKQAGGMAVMLVLTLYMLAVFGWSAIAARRLLDAEDVLRLTTFATENDLEVISRGRPGGTPSAALKLRSTGQQPYTVANTHSTNAMNAFGLRVAGECVLETDIPLPNILLVVRRRRPWLSQAEFPVRDQELSLGGGLDRRYRLYCPTGYERDALYLFTLDVLSELVDDGGKFDVELVGNRVVLRSERTMVTTDPEVWQRIAKAVHVLQQRVTQWSRWRDDRLLEPAGEFVPLSSAPSGVHRSGRRLRTTMVGVGFLVVMFGSAILGLMLLAPG